uniref:Sulfotransferase domain-containing protein n=1 Tax=Odontella aurita TaxID=265563 RepID=A0A7S4KA88_9STRA
MDNSSSETLQQGADVGAAGFPDSEERSEPGPSTTSGSGVALPPLIDRNYGEISRRFPAGTRNHIPVFWSVPRSGSNVMLATFGGCLKLVVANELGGARNHDNEQTLQIHRTSNGMSYANVDPTTVEGIQRSQLLGLSSSIQVDVIFTPLVNLAAPIFTPTNPGRIFALFRHPVERAISRYHQLRKVDPRVRSVTLEEWASWDASDDGGGDSGPEDNWMTKSLLGANEYTPPLTDGDRDVALEILKRKILVGLADDIPASVRRFEKYFGWDKTLAAGDASMVECRNDLMEKVPAQGNKQQSSKGFGVEEGDEVWMLLAERNRYDLEVYEFARYLWRIQAALVR